MPPRLNKRQQRELEELEALGGTTKPSGSESTDDEAPVAKNKGVFASASLFTPDVDEDDDTDGIEPSKKSKKSKKKKKKSAGAKGQNDSEAKIPVQEPTLPPQPVPQSPAKPEQKDNLTPSERKALKKAKQKEKRVKEDDLDKALAELAIQLPPQQNFSQATVKGQSLSDLLGVSLQHLDAEAELRKFFGSRVVQATKTKTSSPSRRNAGALKSHLTRPQPTWWSASQREGLSIRPLTQTEVDEKCKRRSWEAINEKWWTVEYSKKYKSMTSAFMQTVLSGDPQGFYELLRKLPWHADTLLQLSEVYRHREEHSQAVDFIDRALFTYERSFIGAFNFTSGLNRLDFDHVENRPFFLALHRQVVDLQRRGCIRTAFEFARLLYSLEPWTDPHGSLLHLDQLAIKANMAQWLVDVYDVFNNRQASNKDNRLDASLLPGWRYSYALALHILEKNEDHARSTTALTEAIKDFPSIIPLLADKLEISLPAFVRAHPECRIELDARSMSRLDGIIHLLSHLYAQRSFPIWKDHTTWFSDTVATTFASLTTPTSSLSRSPKRTAFFTLVYASEDIQWSFYRHVFVLEASFRRLLSFIPQEVLKEKTLSCDPLPPKNAITAYDEKFFEGVEDLFAYRPRTRRERELDRRRLAQMIPDAGFREQLEGFFEAQGLEQRFPGGIVQFAQAMAQLPPQQLEDLMINGMFAMDAGGGPGPEGVGGGMDPGFFGVGAMPGQMPGQDMLEGINEGPEAAFGVDAAGAGAPRDRGVEEQDRPAREPDAGEDEDEEGDEDIDEDEEDEDEIAPMPRMIRNILGRLWGRAAPAEEESSSDEGEDNNPADMNTTPLSVSVALTPTTMPFFPSGNSFVINGGDFFDFSGNFNISTSGPNGIDLLLEAAQPDATEDSLSRQTAPRCHPGTREQYIEDIVHWAAPGIVGIPQPPLFWMKGPAGVGKSAIAQSSAERLKEMSIPCVAFFFSINGRDRPERLFPTIAYQLATLFPDYREMIKRKIEQDKMLVRKSMPSQFRGLIVEPFKELIKAGQFTAARIPIIVDGLDECEGIDAQTKVVDLVSSAAQEGIVPLCWAFFSRPEAHVEATFGEVSTAGICHSVVLPVSRDSDSEIALYLREGFSSLVRRHNFSLGLWPSEQAIVTLVNAADGFFIYCSTVLRFIELSCWAGPEEPLQSILQLISGSDRSGVYPRQQKSLPFAELDLLYTFVMERIPVEMRIHVRLFLGLMCMSYPSLSSRVPWTSKMQLSSILLSNVLGWSSVEFQSVCSRLSSVLYIQNEPEPPALAHYVDIAGSYTHANSAILIQSHFFTRGHFGGSPSFYHKSFFDFLSDPERSGSHAATSPEARNYMFKLLLICISLMMHCFPSPVSPLPFMTLSLSLKTCLIAHGATVPSIHLCWRASNEFYNSLLRAEVHDFLYELILLLGTLRDLDPVLRGRISLVDFRKSFRVQASLRGVAPLPIEWLNEMTSSPGSALFFNETRLFWAGDDVSQLYLSDFMETITLLEQAGVLQKLNPNPIRSPEMLRAHGCLFGLYQFGHGCRSIIWYWEYSPNDNYYQEFQSTSLHEGIQKYHEEDFTSWPIGYYYKHGSRVPNSSEAAYGRGVCGGSLSGSIQATVYQDPVYI
ncbi:hypothetical protein NP233_g923 [Leucocoprinus birnbaumii]|uniref:Nephrocystin 3-like N-terminal domain-containing protein n=1 Tax=Leucocoprinus birnbaumii TaxID=56174 RepID=A0AAD5W351_9AGAR|nr:hypothetical protein NP233_g923 [Leucocoprinus birnbaumii]